ncbi:hypothetical protein FMUND_185 [Fusarium mundagurra]|uniref:NACHT domain-containing protein n=1 Tax=Fusarium mundagurra TaxID=1567541 RepID=A0A8H5Z882_9HYPO|nr:hypothetical protein FMUND_185 [Fusarium mundagurra]
MTTGFEIIGTFAALYQLFNVSAAFITEWKAVYDGERTAESYLKEHAQSLDEACKLTQARYQTIGSSEKLSETERHVQKTASKCHASAQGLLEELKFVEKEQKDYNCMGAFTYVIKSKVHRKNIERMEARFKNDQQELQTILQSEILSQNNAMQYLQKGDFENLTADIQILIKQVSEGFFGLEGFIKAQHKATNKIIETRLDATDNLIVHGVAEVQQGIKEHFTAAQREIFLDSFRYPEINMRYNDVLDSSEANFDRVFASYEKVTKHDQKSVLSEDDSSHFSSEASEYDASRNNFPDIDSDELRTIDKTWSSFINWLRSSDPLFCIQGKPGSGKSTLIKFMIDNKNTQRLLEHQSPDIVIMSHFFWKIGSKEQSSIKGFLCSLVHQLLARSEHLQELVMGLYATSSHKSYHDWSSRSLKTLLHQILETKSHAICVFVDGLDEVANDDGLDKLTREIEEVLQFPGIKICVSSRPEASVIKWLERLRISSILLEDLTRPEMSSYVHKGLDPLLSSKKLSVATHQYLCDAMVRKSQGVFLWLSLVLRSLVDGIQNGDTEQILMRRLAELPSKIHDLYADIWDRLNERNPVYRRDATRFVLYVLMCPYQAVYFRRQEHPVNQHFYVGQPALGQIAFAEMPDRHEALLKYGAKINFKEVQDICYRARSQIESRCGGLLQIRMRENGKGIPSHDHNDLRQEVAFIHRTAYDFFTNTEVGESMLRADSATRFGIAACAAKGLLCLHRILAHRYGVCAEMFPFSYYIGQISDKGNAPVVAKVISMLPDLQSLFAEKVIAGSGIWQPKCHFLTYLVPYISFHEFILSEIEKASSAKLATQVLQELCYEIGMCFSSNGLVPLGLIGSLLSMGADAHACITGQGLVQGQEKLEEQLAIRGTPFANLLRLSITAYVMGSNSLRNIATLVSEAVATMTMTCPDLNDATLIVFRAWNTGRIMMEKDTIAGGHEKNYISIFLEAKLSFLVTYLFSQLKPFIKESAVFKGFPGKLESPTPEVRFIFNRDELLDKWVCNRISSQKCCEKLVDFLFPCEGPPPQAKALTRKTSNETKKRFDHLVALLGHMDVVPCDFESEMLSMAAQKLGFCSFQEAVISKSTCLQVIALIISKGVREEFYQLLPSMAGPSTTAKLIAPQNVLCSVRENGIPGITILYAPKPFETQWV